MYYLFNNDKKAFNTANDKYTSTMYALAFEVFSCPDAVNFDCLFCIFS